MEAIKIAYLAGIIDGEGYFGVIKSYGEYTKVDGTPSPRFRAKMVIVNTDLRLITACSEILKEIGVKHYVRTVILGGMRRTRFNIEVSALKSVAKLAEIVLPYLVAKKEQAEVMIAYSKLPTLPCKLGRGKNEAMVNAIVLKLQELKKVDYVPVETVCQTPKANAMEKIQSELHGDVQKQAEMPCSLISNN
jgi:hypothetical protein